MKKHTPGPWKVGINGNDSLSIWTIAPSTNVVAVLHDVPHENNTKANAHLIAAAPELLNACVAAFHYIFRDGKQVADNDWSKERVLEFIKAAIAKAESKE